MKSYLWSEKYRPDIEGLILVNEVKSVIKKIVDEKEIGNYIFYGGSGTGKTSAAKALCNALDRDYMFLNGTNCGVNTLRYTIPEFASSLSLERSGKKVIIIDEAEKMTDEFSQGFNSFIEQFHKTCSFILTTNFPDKFMKALDSRFVKIGFDVRNKTEKVELFKLFLKRLKYVLDEENIEYDINIVKEYSWYIFPDMRKCLNSLQYNTRDGKISEEILGQRDNSFRQLLILLKDKQFKKMIEFVEAEDIKFEQVMDDMSRNLLKVFDIKEIPEVLKIMNEAQYRHGFAINKKINLLDFLTLIMKTVKSWPQSLK